MSEFENWLKGKWKHYKFKKRKMKFGDRLVGKLKLKKADRKGREGRAVLMYHVTERKLITKVFARFLNDFERVYDGKTGETEDNDGTCYALDVGKTAYFVLYGDNDKKPFDILLEKAKWYLIDRVKIKSLSEPWPLSPFGGYFDATRNERYL